MEALVGRQEILMFVFRGEIEVQRQLYSIQTLLVAVESLLFLPKVQTNHGQH